MPISHKEIDAWAYKLVREHPFRPDRVVLKSIIGRYLSASEYGRFSAVFDAYKKGRRDEREYWCENQPWKKGHGRAAHV